MTEQDLGIGLHLVAANGVKRVRSSNRTPS